ncbi:MAG TPA: HD-GYP domain-containing protein [Solirubrobacterales bacterium]|nr:HD-GYP domain-containing protein [Solirubrobacterales bacterium]
MDPSSPRSPLRKLPLSLGATFLVVVLPCLFAVALRVGGVVISPVPLVLMPVLLSLALSLGLAAIWRRRPESGHIRFEDLMIWGWVRDMRFERLLSRSENFVGANANSDLTAEQRARELERLSRALEAPDPRTYGHSRRVARHAARMAERMRLPAEEVARIRTAALLHDVGKIETPRTIIDKPAKLTDDEYEVIKRHPVTGAVMVEGLGDPELTAIVRHHHERIDGGGYPDGIEGSAIPLGARIIAVADTFDALTSARPYRGAMAHEKAMAVLAEESGRQLDAAAVDAFRHQYGGHRPVAAAATVLGVGRQVGQGLVSLGSGASQVAAVGAAATVLGTAPIHSDVPKSVDSGEPKTQLSAPAASATGGGVTTADAARATRGTSAGERPGRSDRNDPGTGPADEIPAGSGRDGAGHGGDRTGSGGDGGGTQDPGGAGTDGGSGSAPLPSGSPPIEKPAENPMVLPPPVHEALDQIPPVPEQVPGSGTINDVVDDIKDLPGKLLGGG